jgi:hypothetical protein
MLQHEKHGFYHYRCNLRKICYFAMIVIASVAFAAVVAASVMLPFLQR